MSELAAPTLAPPNASTSRRGVWTTAGAGAALVYLLTIGGTPAGEVLGWLRVINTALAAVFVLLYLLKAPRRADPIDRLILVAVLLMALSAVASAFPRQALDALLAGLTYAAIFYVARDAMSLPSRAGAILWTMRAMSLVVALVMASRLLPAAVEWWQLTGGDAPPIGLPIVARPWGHAYDLVLLGLMLAPSWIVRPVGRVRSGVAVAVLVVLGVVVLMQGARALWLAVGLAALAVTLPYLAGVMGPFRRRAAVWVGIAAAAVLVALTFGGPILERLLTSATVGQRLAMWTASAEAWLQRPLVGFGPGTFPWILQSTDYFATNSIHPRHPDSAVFQLLPEMGLVGIAAVIVVAVAVVVPLIRRRQHLALWPVTLLAGAALAANPTDFSYLVVVAILWAAYGLPRTDGVDSAVSAAWVRRGIAAGLVVPASFLIATVMAGIAYDRATAAAADGDFESARASLDVAVILDPGMAIYARQRGISSLLIGDEPRALDELARAVRLNPSDDLSWRALALARDAAHDSDGAMDALQHALALQRSDPANLLLLAAWQADAGDLAPLSDTAAEIALAWPGVLAAPGWTELTADLRPAEVVQAALERWRRGLPSPEPLRQQPLMLAATAGRPDLFAEASELTNESDDIASSVIAVIQCHPGAAAKLDSIPVSDRRTSTYWGLRIQQASQEGREDPDALELYRLITATLPSSSDVTEPMNPLHENNAQGSADAWGYDRVAIAWSRSPVALPSPSAGSSRWLLDPAASRAAMGLNPGSCAAP